jgi:hypothetical protein
MFLATSVTFDEVLVVAAVNPQNGPPIRGIVCYLVGLVFAIVVSALILRGLQLKLPALYRVPYYLMLALFFLYPLALLPLLGDPRGEALQWSLFAFSSVAGLIFLTLLPAIRRGAAYVRGNGSPWPWPMYPWSLFVFLAAAVLGRAFLLCYSMHPIAGVNVNSVIFGPYFLVPFGLALAVLILEIALTSERTLVHWIAMLLPAFLVGLAMIGHRGDPIYRGFLDTFTQRLGGDPVFCTLIAVAAFYAYAAIRRAAWAFEALTTALALLALIGTNSVDRGLLAEPLPAPLLIAATLLLGVGVLNQQSWRCLAGALGLALGLALAFPLDAEVTPYRAPIVFHLMTLIVLIVGAAFSDVLARALRTLGVAIVLCAGLGAMVIPLAAPPWWLEVYPLLLTLLLAGYAYWHRPALACSGVLFACWSLVSGWQIYRVCRQLVVGLDYLVLSLLVFVLAIVVSLAKAGVLARWYAAWRQRAPDGVE